MAVSVYYQLKPDSPQKQSDSFESGKFHIKIMKDGNGIYMFFFFKTTDSVSASLDTVWYLEKKKTLVTAVCDGTKNNVSFSGVTESKSVFFP